MVAACVNYLNAAESLRFLFRLDTYLYDLQSAKAVAYGNGLHTKHRHIKYHDFFTSRITEKDSVLDIGCGNGALAYSVAKKTGAMITGIDINTENIAIAKSRFSHANIQFVVGDVMDRISRNHYDVIILSNVLEHLTNRSDVLKKLQNNIQPDRFLIRVPIFDRDWRVPLKKELNIEWRLDPTHEIEYTNDSFKIEIEAARLQIIHQEIKWGEIWAEVKRIES